MIGWIVSVFDHLPLADCIGKPVRNLAWQRQTRSSSSPGTARTRAQAQQAGQNHQCAGASKEPSVTQARACVIFQRRLGQLFSSLTDGEVVEIRLRIGLGPKANQSRLWKRRILGFGGVFARRSSR